MKLILNKDTPVFDIDNLKILDKQLCPRSLITDNLSKANVMQWIYSRVLQQNRVNSENIYKAIGISNGNYLELAYKTHAFSITDNYWIAESSEINNMSYYTKNLFQNELDDYLSDIALQGKSNKEPKNLKSAEFTGQGTYPKCFIRQGNNIYICKHQRDEEITNEVMAGYIAKLLGFNSVYYTYEKIQGLNCAVSKIESGLDQNWENAFDIAKHIQDNYGMIPQEFAIRSFGRSYTDLAVFDSIILNADRHMKNWAFNISPETGKYMGIAPSYDYNRAFEADRGLMSQLIFDGHRKMNVLNAGKYVIDNYGTNLNLNNLLNNLDKIPDCINKNALRNRLLYITRQIDSPKYCY